MTNAHEFARRLRAGEQLIGYWTVLDAPIINERIARIGYDYVCIDAQHGLVDFGGWISGLIAIDAGSAIAGKGAVGLVRVPSNNPAFIGQALDAGAAGVIVPLVNTPEDAAAAVAAVRYPPDGVRSYGPMRSQLRIGPAPAESDESVVLLVMIETAEGLENAEAIARVPGVDGLYIGPSDLRLAVGGRTPDDPAADAAFAAALNRIRDAAEAAGVAACVHTPSGSVAAQRRSEGFSVVTIASDLVHIDQTARAHLQVALGGPSEA